MSDALHIVNAYPYGGQLFFQVPNIEESVTNVNLGKKESVVIFVIDTSGSMSGDYPHLAKTINALKVNSKGTIIHTIFFDSIGKDKGTGVLPLKTQFGGTNISCGIDMLINVTEKYINKGHDHITIGWISDGQDTTGTLNSYLQHTFPTKMAKIKKSGCFVDFLCIGVGTGFPTHIAMKFREQFHTGRENIPNVFLIKGDNGVSRYDMYGPQFATIKEFFGTIPKVTVYPHVRTYPWKKTVDLTTFVGTWCIIENVPGIDKITIENTDYNIIKSEWTMNVMISVFKQWASRFNALCLSDNTKEHRDKIKKLATNVVTLMRKMKQHLDSKLSSKLSVKEYAKLTCKQRLEKALRKANHELDEYIRVFKSVMDGTFLNDLSDEALAARLAIGTVHGKYTERSIKARGGIDEAQFKKIMNDFTKVMDKKLEQLEDQDDVQDMDAVALETFYDIVLQEDIKQCLLACPDQYLLVNQVMSCVGSAFVVDRSPNAASFNPYSIRILEQPVHNRTFGTISMIEFQRNEGAEFKYDVATNEITDGDLDPNGVAKIPMGGYHENINAIVPMFKRVDNNLKPFLRTELFSLLSTWGYMRNADVIVHEVIMAALSQVLCFCLKQEWTDHIREVTNMINPTLEMVYVGRPLFNKYMDMMKSDDYHKCFVTYNEKFGIRCEAISKILLYLWYLKDELSLDKQKDLMRLTYFEMIARMVDGKNVEDFFAITDVPDDMKAHMTQDVSFELLEVFGLEKPINYFTLAKYKQAVTDAYKRYYADFEKQDHQVKYQFNKEKVETLYNVAIGDVCVERLRQFLTMYFGEGNDEDSLGIDLEYMTYHAVVTNSSLDRHCNTNKEFTRRQYPSKSETQSLIEKYLVNKEKKRFKVETLDKLLDAATDYYDIEFYKIHKVAIPLSKEEIILLKGKAYWTNVCQKVNKLVLNKTKSIRNYNEDTNMMRNACMCPGCPFFLKETTQLLNHIDPWIRRKEVAPALHKACKLRHKDNDEDIFKDVADGSQLYVGKQKPALYNKEDIENARELLMADIKLLKKRYAEIAISDMTYAKELKSLGM